MKEKKKKITTTTQKRELHIFFFKITTIEYLNE